MAEERGRRKKDFVSILAILLFAFTILFEIYIIYLIPSLLRQESRWKKDLIIEELLEVQDELRAEFTGSIHRHKSLEAELALAKSCLDNYAKYFRENKDLVNIEQGEEILLKLLEFKRLHEKFWYKNPHSISSDRKMDVSKFINLQEKKLK